MEVLTRRLEGSPGGLSIDGNEREGVVVNPDDFGASEPFRGRDGILDPHGEVVADAEDGEPERTRQRNQLDVPGQGGVAAIVEGPLGRLHAEAAGLTAIGAVGHAAGVDRGGEGDATEVEVPGAAGIHRVDFLNPLGSEPLEDLVVADQGGAAQAGDRLDVGNMIEMAVRDENVIGAEVRVVDRGGQGIRRDEGVEEQCLAGDLDGEAGVAVIGDVHGAHPHRS